MSQSLGINVEHSHHPSHLYPASIRAGAICQQISATLKLIFSFLSLSFLHLSSISASCSTTSQLALPGHHSWKMGTFGSILVDALCPRRSSTNAADPEFTHSTPAFSPWTEESTVLPGLTCWVDSYSNESVKKSIKKRSLKVSPTNFIIDLLCCAIKVPLASMQSRYFERKPSTSKLKTHF